MPLTDTTRQAGINPFMFEDEHVGKLKSHYAQTGYCQSIYVNGDGLAPYKNQLISVQKHSNLLEKQLLLSLAL